jgi:hypothetical protein
MQKTLRVAAAIYVLSLSLIALECGAPPAEEIEANLLRGLPNGAQIVARLDIAHCRDNFQYERLKDAIEMNSGLNALYEKTANLTGLDMLKHVDGVVLAGYGIDASMPTFLLLAEGDFDPTVVKDTLRKLAKTAKLEEHMFSRFTYHKLVMNYQYWFISFPSERFALFSNGEEQLKHALSLFLKHNDSLANNQAISNLVAELDQRAALWIIGINTSPQGAGSEALSNESKQRATLARIVNSVRAYVISIDFVRGFKIKSSFYCGTADEAGNLKQTLAKGVALLRQLIPDEATFVKTFAREVRVTSYEKRVSLTLEVSEEDLQRHKNDLMKLHLLTP